MNRVNRQQSAPTNRIIQLLGLAAVFGAGFTEAAISLASEATAGSNVVLTTPGPFESLPEKGIVTLGIRRSLLLRAKVDIHRTAVVDPAICEIVQTTPRELSLVGRAAGQTNVTFWFSEPGMAPLTYTVEVKP
jgi:Flp pilus assembly secretin CpaC